MSGWVVKIGGVDYPAGDRAMIAEWFREQRITDGSMIFDPERAAWLSLAEYAAVHAPSVIVTTTNSLDGYRILRYLAIETAAADASTFGSLGGNLDAMRDRTLNALRARAVLHGGNAVVGIAFDYVLGRRDSPRSSPRPLRSCRSRSSKVELARYCAALLVMQ